MKVRLVKRKRVIHAGIIVRDPYDSKPMVISVCNGRWCCEDTVTEGESSEITCKSCTKYAKEAEENDGVVVIKPKRRR